MTGSEAEPRTAARSAIGAPAAGHWPKKIPKNTRQNQYSPHLNPVHVGATPSLLSRRLRPSRTLIGSEPSELPKYGGPPLDVSGFKHLLMLVLVTGNVKMMWKDWALFGFWNTLKHFGLGVDDLKMALFVFGTNLLYMPVALVIEKAASRFAFHCGHFPFDALHASLCILCVSVGSTLTWRLVDHPLMATACEANTIVTFLKLTSFVLTNTELRKSTPRAGGAPESKARASSVSNGDTSGPESTKATTDGDLLLGNVPEFYTNGPAYPQNLTLRNMLHFWLAPTLVYQPVYPLRQEIRWGRVLSVAAEILTGMVLIWVLMMQMALPVLEHFVKHRASLQVAAEDYLSLTTLNITIWVVGFLVLFQSTLNLAAEITRFADRGFYGDWWNAGSVGTFWRDWNRPVSNYFRRHVYTPLRLMGASRMLASNAVFFVSALLHELLFGVATHNFNGVAFLSMMLQPILILLTEPLEKSRGKGTALGNTVMWLTILFGQPTAIVVYYLEWVERNPASKGSALWFKFGQPN